MYSIALTWFGGDVSAQLLVSTIILVVVNIAAVRKRVKLVSIMRNVLSIILIFCVNLNWGCTGGSSRKRE